MRLTPIIVRAAVAILRTRCTALRWRYRTQRLYFRTNVHLTPAGHAIVAPAVAQEIFEGFLRRIIATRSPQLDAAIK